MASVLVDRSNELNQLFGNISSKFSSVEAADVVKSSKRIYGKQFEKLQNEDLQSLGTFVASKSNNKEEIEKTIDNYVQVNTLQVDSEKQMQGRDNNVVGRTFSGFLG